MRFFRVLRCDLRLALGRQWRYLLLLPAGMLLFCANLYRWVQEMEPGALLDLQDYLVYIFGGMGRYSPSPDEPFLFPGIWVCSVGLMLFLMLRYPREELYESGQQLLQRSGGRCRYWIAKCVLQLVMTVCCFALAYGTVLLFTLLTRGTLLESLNGEWVEILGRVNVNWDEIAQSPPWMYLMPPATVLLMAGIQQIVSLLTGISIGYLVSLGLMIASAYFMTPWLAGNYGMLYRAGSVMAEGFAMEQSLLVCVLAWVLMSAAGGVYFCRMDILKREELE